MHHYGVTVSDLEVALDFYRDRLGLEVTDTISFDDAAFGTFVDVDGADVDIAFLDAGGAAIELIDYNAPSGDDATDVANNDVGAAHVCLEVDDAAAVYESFRPAVEFVSPPQTLENGATVAYMCDPDGNIVEILEE